MKGNVEFFKSVDQEFVLTVSFDKEAVRLNRKQLSQLFERDKKTIINNIFKVGEIPEDSVAAKFATAQKEGQ